MCKSQKGGKQEKQNTLNFLKNKHFLTRDIHTYMLVSDGKKCTFFGIFDALCFLVTSLLRFPLLPHYR